MLATILAGIAVVISGVTCVVVLVLLGRKEFPYPGGEDQDGLPKKVKQLIKNQAVLWRALEDLDDRVSDAGLSVLRPAVPRDEAETGQRPVR